LITFCCRLPVFCADDWQANISLLIDVWMVNLCLEANFWRLKGIFGWECYFNAKSTLIVRNIILKFSQKK
jgi:hypothetical protein